MEETKETIEEREKKLAKEVMDRFDKKMDEQIREATIKSVINTLMNLPKTEIVVYDETMKSDLRRMSDRTNEYVQKLECEFRSEQQFIKQQLADIMDSQINIARLLNKILETKKKKKK